jgi:hypothetical protein
MVCLHLRRVLDIVHANDHANLISSRKAGNKMTHEHMQLKDRFVFIEESQSNCILLTICVIHMYDANDNKM